MDFQGFLNDLQGWELSVKDKAKKTKPQAYQKEKMGSSSLYPGLVGEKQALRGDTASLDYSSTTKYAVSHGYSSYASEDIPDAASEKELGNEYFKQKKFKEAIDCYSRSIGLSPTAVAYANRAMAYLKLRRFQEAEDDCTDAINLDDRYIKAYSRRSTARKELGKLKDSLEDAEFAMRLEPNNQEVKKQHVESKSLYEKEILRKASGALSGSLQGAKKAGKSETIVNGHSTSPISKSYQKPRVAEVQDQTKGNGHQFPTKASFLVKETDGQNRGAASSIGGQAGGSEGQTIQSSSIKSVKRNSERELKASIEDLASRAASRAKAEAAKNITPPTSAYQFEVSWRAFSGDRALQAHILKAISPNTLPDIFKNSLSASLLIDIIKCLASFFTEEMDLSIKYLEHLTKVPRFDLLVMCLSSTSKDVLHKIWDEVFCSKVTPIEHAEVLDNLRMKYCPRQ